MDELKGVGTIVVLCPSAAHGRVEFVRYRDGSVGVRVEGRTVGVWEPHEREDAYECFFAYAHPWRCASTGMEGNGDFSGLMLLFPDRVGPSPGIN